MLGRRARPARPISGYLPLSAGVEAVLTAAELKPLNLHYMPTLAGDVQAALADEKVLFQNQHVTCVVANDRYVAADALELVEVEYEPLPVLVDTFRAPAEDAPVLRENLAGKTDDAHGARRHHNHIFSWEVGDKERTNAICLGPAHRQGADLLPAHAPCHARDLRLRRADGQGEG